jgi:hypothetical protein
MENGTWFCPVSHAIVVLVESLDSAAKKEG